MSQTGSAIPKPDFRYTFVEEHFHAKADSHGAPETDEDEGPAVVRPRKNIPSAHWGGNQGLSRPRVDLPYIHTNPPRLHDVNTSAPRKEPLRSVRFGDADDASSITEDGHDSDLDLVSVTSSEIPDRRRWKNFDAEDGTQVVYEAWELVSVDDTVGLDTWKKLFGIRFGATYESMQDGFLAVSPLPGPTQKELAKEVEQAERDHKDGKSKSKSKSYEQDLADRAYRLPPEIYNRLERLINRKINQANQNPHRVRHWEIALLREEEQAITRLNPDRRLRGWRRALPWNWSGHESRPAMDRWYFVLRGWETRHLADEPWGAYDAETNPWFRVDREDNLRDEELRMERKLKSTHQVPRYMVPRLENNRARRRGY